MKIYNINQKSEYPDNYDFLSKKTKKDILTYMNDQQTLANTYYEKHIIYAEEMKEEYLNLYDHQLDLMCGAKNILSLLGIKIEFGWRHDGKWILATKDDWQRREDEKEQEICEYKEKLKKLKEGYKSWPTPKGGRNLNAGRM